MFAAPPELGGEDWSFEYPYIIPPGEIDLAITPTGYLKKGDVDVLKYVAAEWEEFCIMLNCIVPLCARYENFYPVIGILGPGVPKDDEFPFAYPEDCQDCGFKRVHPLHAKAGERPGGYGPPGVDAEFMVSLQRVVLHDRVGAGYRLDAPERTGKFLHRHIRPGREAR